jgi:hypothetical protein
MAFYQENTASLIAKDGYTRRLALHAGGCGYTGEMLVVDRRITGKIASENGLSVANVPVELVSRRPTQTESMAFGGH